MGSSGRFGKLFWSAVEAGLLRNLTGMELRAYCAVSAHADRHGVAFPSSETIAKLLGIEDARTVRRALASVVQKGFLQIAAQGGGRSRSTAYRVVANWGGRNPVCDENRGNLAPVTGTKPGQNKTETGASECRNRGSGAPPTEGTKIEQQHSEVSAEPAAGKNSPSEEKTNRLALAAAGIGEPTRSRLASRSGVTPTVIRNAGVHAESRGLHVGGLVREIEARAETAVASEARRRGLRIVNERATAEQAEAAAKEAAEREADEVHLADERRVFDALSPNEVEQGRQAVLSQMSPGQLATYGKMEPAKSQTLRRLVVEWAAANGRAAR